MNRDERMKWRDRRVSSVRRITAWAAAGSLAVAAGLAAIFGVSQAATTGSASTNTTTTDTQSSGSGSSSSGLQPSSGTPSSSSTAGTVTSGGS
jgi:hypothetical protein